MKTFFIFGYMKISDLHQLFLKSNGVGTDTRKDLTRMIFFALKGENFNGNRYAAMALKKGALMVVVDEEIESESNQIIQVNDVLQTLQELARYHRDSLDIPVLAITGSNGKTTNKELLSLVLSKKYKVYSTKGNFNNHIGVPLSLLEIDATYNFAVIEMGANKLGDIAELCEIADPDYGFITNIGVAHLEGFKSQNNIKIGKGELFEYVKRKGGKIYINRNEEKVVEIGGKYSNALIISEHDNDHLHFHLLRSTPDIKIEVDRNGESHIIGSHLYGKHNYENIKMVVGIGLDFDIKLSEITEAILAYVPKNNRSQVIIKGHIRLYMDAYNANPSSMMASIKSFILNETGNKLLILGDMLELGNESNKWHKQIYDTLIKKEKINVVFIGENFYKLKDKSQQGFDFYQDTSDTDRHLKIDFEAELAILVKGSRGQRLETLEILTPLIEN